MKEKYCITQIGHLPGKVLDFENAIMVKVIPSDFVHFYYYEKSDPDYKEIVMNNEKLLLFNNYNGKERWLAKKEYDSDEGIYWEIDLEDFTPGHVHETDHETGDVYLRTLYVVNMVNSHLDVVEAKEKGMSVSVKTGSQRLLEQSDLPIVGRGDRKFYLVGYDNDGYAYGISYNSPERDEGGHFKVDQLIYEDDDMAEGGIRIIHIKRYVGIYNYLIGQFFKFADR